MNVTEERTRSLWMEVESPSAPALDREEKADVLVIGAGIAGLSTAYELATKGRSVVVLDRGPVATGMTARTTAHLASEIDDYYDELIKVRGLEQAHIHYESQASAISRIETIQAEEGIECDFQRVDGYLFANEGADASVLEREHEAAPRAGQDVAWAERAPFSGVHSGRCLRFPRQARVHPLKYLNGLVGVLERRDVRLYGHTCATTIDEQGGRVTVDTGLGHKVHAGAVVVATNSPINDRVAIHTKQAPYRTYVVAGRIERGSVPDALYWDTHDPYHYVRLQPRESDDLLIIGGADHKNGEADDGEARLQALEAWARRHFPELREISHRWSGQVMEPVDYVGFIGRNPGNENIYVATGDSGQGITTGVVASLLLSELILTGKSRWSELYEPSRKPIGAAAEYMSENLTMVKNLSEYLTPGDLSSLEELKPGHGAVVRQGLKKIAVFRDDSGSLHLRSAVCPHMGCIVHWNSLERCWDCPCHGSQFAADGTALNAPAFSSLERIEA